MTSIKVKHSISRAFILLNRVLQYQYACGSSSCVFACTVDMQHPCCWTSMVTVDDCMLEAMTLLRRYCSTAIAILSYVRKIEWK
jgi:hypothetical protein